MSVRGEERRRPGLCGRRGQDADGEAMLAAVRSVRAIRVPFVHVQRQRQHVQTEQRRYAQRRCKSPATIGWCQILPEDQLSRPCVPLLHYLINIHTRKFLACTKFSTTSSRMSPFASYISYEQCNFLLKKIHQFSRQYPGKEELIGTPGVEITN